MVIISTEATKVTGVVSFYMAAALVMVFVNKATLNANPDLPLLFIFNQLILAVIFLHISALFTKHIDLPRLSLRTAKDLFAVVFVNIVGLAFNTLCLRDVEASFFQIARGMVLPLTIAASSIQTRSRPSALVLLAAGCVTIGFLLGIVPSRTLPVHAIPSGLSLLYGFLSALFIAVHAVLIKSSLPHVNNSAIQLAYWTNLGSAIMLLPVIVFDGEASRLFELVTSQIQPWDWRPFLWGSLVTGVFGYLLCVAGLLSIKVTSPITHMFSSAVRSVLQVLLGIWIFGDILTVNRLLSIGTILLGTMYYTWIKSQEMAKPRQDKEPTDEKG
ncbi:hypothetical protein DACRYDRAFT_74687 [Dacryopinax primogenitus]|uniref:Sugar phosphate transporter domain-containing protein n=1 Tax=Dacryopinax primogenitus (strain DJM 731) TaxID=1858805 RepID=M5G9J2_DACPD|nr:uncharacterized protein DACRYDRAFT_74687 [Dacryopinax primogenitus]EJU05464.1 hypothetical protein DACRYDRAFT_74687 [Dacryopinax primogenitus]